MADDGLQIKFYLQKLSDDDLDAGHQLAMAHYEHAAKFCGWLDDAFSGEKVRRLKQSTGQFIESEYGTLPAHEYTNTELWEALAVVTAASYTTRRHQLGQFIDKLVRAVVVAVGARLKLLEEIHGTNASTL